ncbi:mucolipin-3-like [Dysidea avara]|uniref:mucolipin-3-like n=1 Tax=Dysidea avara TaxID=196820 RepID=UPI00333495A4
MSISLSLRYFGKSSKSTVSWCSKKAFRFTIGSCCCLPCCENASSDGRELTDYVTEDREPLLNKGSDCTKKTLTERADCNMKQRLRRHYQDHVQKWSREKSPRFPWKAALHLLLVAFVTTQVSIFASHKYKLTSFLVQNTKSFHNYFIRKECGTSINKLYSLDDVYKQLEHTVNSYYNMSQQSVSEFNILEGNVTVKNATKLTMIIDYDVGECGDDEVDTIPCKYKNLTSYIEVFPYNPNTSSADMRQEDEPCCNEDSTSGSCSIEYCNCSVKSQVDCYIHGDNLNKIDSIKFHFYFGATYKKGVIEVYNPVHVTFHIVISLKNELYNNMAIDMDIVSTFTRISSDSWTRKTTTIIDAVVLVLLFMSSWTFVLSIIKTGRLAKAIKLHFLAYHKKHLRWQEISTLFNFWYMLMLFTNLLIFLATLIKIHHDYYNKSPINIEVLESISILFGIGNILLWCGLFGILKYFESLNVLLTTVRLALPSIARFAIYIAILFTAFSITGWLVLGSYHSKFGGPTETAVSLFCILNGDDLYKTFTGLEVPSNSIQLFSKLYLSAFMFLFIYIVLSLFIGIFNHAYESLSSNWRQRSRGFLRDWAEGEPDDDPTKNYPFPIPRVRKPAPVTTVLDPVCINNSGDSSLMSSVKIENPVENNLHVPIVHITESTSEPVNNSPVTGGHGLARFPSDSNLLAQPQAHEGRFQRSLSFVSSHERHQGHHHNVAYTSSGTHLMVCQPHMGVKAQVAEPPSATSKEVATARSKLWASNPHLNLDLDETDA